MQVLFLALEERVFLDLQENVKVAGRPAVGARLPFAADTNSRAVVHARRNVHLELPMHLLVPVSAALATRIADDLPRAAARTARAPYGKETLLVQNLTASAASGTRGGAASWLRTSPAAASTGLHLRNLNFRGH